MRFETPSHAEFISPSKVRNLADSAEEWARTLDLERYPSAHISKALQGIPNGRERDLMFGAIRRELNRRAHAHKTRSSEEAAIIKEVERMREKERRQRTMAEAYAHQMRQPRDAWDSSAD